MALNPRASKSGSANSSSEPGGIFQGKITLVYDDGTVRVFVRMLGINIGPCRIVGKQHDEEFLVNDEVLVAYLDNLKGEMVVIGRLTDRPGAEAATTEPIGHEDKTESVISFNNSTRVFTIAPVGESFNVWCVGRRYTKTAAESITLPATTGLYYIYYSSTGVLSSKTSYFTWDQDAPTAYIYYNSATEEAEFFADERHGVTLDWATHEYLHRTRGASLAEGLGASGYTLAGTGDSNADIQISIENGTFFDEDLEVNITHSATPTANTWEQRLQSPAYIPMFYRFGSSGAWRLDTATAYPVKYGSARATYNLSSSGTWSTPDMTSGKFGVTWIVATNNLNEPVIGILGQTVSDNIGQAEDVSYADLDLTGLPIVEIRPLYKLIYETNTGYTNAVKSRLASIADIRVNQAINFGIGAGALSSLTDVSLTVPAANDVLVYNGSSWTDANSLTLGNLQLGVTAAGELDTNSGNLTIDSAGGTTTIDDNLVVSGNLTVNGTTTTLNTDTLVVEDNIIILNSNVSGSPTLNAGIEIERGTSTNVLFRWNETSDKWEFTNDGSSYGNLAALGTIALGTDTTGNYMSGISGTSPISVSHTPGEGSSATISLASGYGDTQNPYASKTANYFLAAPNGSSGTPTFRAIVAADIPTLNQNTTGTAATVTGATQASITSVGTLTGLTSSGSIAISRGALGTSSGNSLTFLNPNATSSNSDSLNLTFNRTSAGTDWTTAAWKFQRRVDVTDMGYIAFGAQNWDLGNGTTSHITGSALTGILTINLPIAATTLAGNQNLSANNTYQSAALPAFGFNAWAGVSSYNFYNASDIRYKTNVQDLPLGMSFLRLLQPIEFTYLYPQFNEDSNEPISIDEGTRLRAGLSAQNVRDALEFLGAGNYNFWALSNKDDETSFQSLDYTGLIAPMIQALKEIDAKVTSLMERIEALENK